MTTTGWPPGMLQDDSRELSRWLANRPGALYQLSRSSTMNTEDKLREALKKLVATTWGLEPATTEDGCYTDSPIEKMARASLAATPTTGAVSEDVQRFAIEVEKMLCAKLGREWRPSGMSIESLVEALAPAAPVVDEFPKMTFARTGKILVSMSPKGMLTVDTKAILESMEPAAPAAPSEPVALNAVADKLRADALKVFHRADAASDVIEWYTGSLYAMSAQPSAKPAGVDFGDDSFRRATPPAAQGAPIEHGQLDPRTATEQARAMVRYCQSFNGQPWGGVNESVDRKNLAVALENLEETSAMLLNMAERVTAQGAPVMAEAPTMTDKEIADVYNALRVVWHVPDDSDRYPWTTMTTDTLKRVVRGCLAAATRKGVGRMIAALYVETDGCYFGVPGLDPWDEARDARKYTGPHPVVCHSPCQRWGRYATGAPNKPNQYRVGEDGGCFASALTSVRNYGGVLEHPKDSKAWPWFGLTTPPPRGNLPGLYLDSGEFVPAEELK